MVNDTKFNFSLFQHSNIGNYDLKSSFSCSGTKWGFCQRKLSYSNSIALSIKKTSKTWSGRHVPWDSSCQSILCCVIITVIYKNKIREKNKKQYRPNNSCSKLARLFAFKEEWCQFTPMEISALIFNFPPFNMSIKIIIVVNCNYTLCRIHIFFVFVLSVLCTALDYFSLFSRQFIFSSSFFCVFSLEILLLFELAKKQVSIFFSRRKQFYLNISWQPVPHPWATMEVPVSALSDKSIVADIFCFCGVPA